MDKPTFEKELETVNIQIDAIKLLLLELEGQRGYIQYHIDEAAFTAKMEAAGYDFTFDHPLSCTAEFRKKVYNRTGEMPFDADDTVYLHNYDPSTDTFQVTGFKYPFAGIDKAMIQDMKDAWHRDMEAIVEAYPPTPADKTEGVTYYSVGDKPSKVWRND